MTIKITQAMMAKASMMIKQATKATASIGVKTITGKMPHILRSLLERWTKLVLSEVDWVAAFASSLSTLFKVFATFAAVYFLFSVFISTQ